MNINEKIKVLIDTFANGNQSAFARATGISSSVLATYLPKNTPETQNKRESSPGFEALVKILEAYPELSADWLLRDSGGIVNNPSSTQETSNNSDLNLNTQDVLETVRVLTDVVTALTGVVIANRDGGSSKTMDEANNTIERLIKCFEYPFLKETQA